MPTLPTDSERRGQEGRKAKGGERRASCHCITHLLQRCFVTGFPHTTYADVIGLWHYRGGRAVGGGMLLLADRGAEGDAGGLDGFAGVALCRRADDERFLVYGDRQFLQLVEIVQQPTPFHVPTPLLETAL